MQKSRRRDIGEGRTPTLASLATLARAGGQGRRPLRIEMQDWPELMQELMQEQEECKEPFQYKIIHLVYFPISRLID